MKHKHRRSKGSRLERAVAKMFSEALNITVRRTPLSGGWAKDNPDVQGDLVCTKPGPAAFPWCVECKNVEGWRLESLFTSEHKWFDKWWEQLLNECPANKMPLLVFSRAYTPIFASYMLGFSGDWSTQTTTTSCILIPFLGDIVVIMLLKDYLEMEKDRHKSFLVLKGV